VKPVTAAYASGSETSRPATATASSGKSSVPSVPRTTAEAEKSRAPSAVASQNTRRCAGCASVRDAATVHAAAPCATAWTARKAASAARHGVLGRSKTASARSTTDAAAMTAEAPRATT